MSLARSAILVSAAAAASRVLGFVRDVMIAGVLGAGPAADAFLVAYRIPNLVRRILTEGGLNAAFVPLYLRFRAEEGDAAARRFAADAMAGLLLVLLALVALVEIAATPLVLLLAAGYADDPATLALARDATRLAFPFVALATVAALLSALLNAERRFLAASLAPLAVNALMIAALLWLRAGGGGPEHGALWLAGIVSASGLAHLVVVAAAGRRLALPLRDARLRLGAPMRRLARVAGPALVASGAAQFIILAGAEAASFQASAVSWFYYAERVFQLPLGFVGAAAGLVLLPELARGTPDDRALSEHQNRALETAALVAIPAALALVVLAQPIVTVLFAHGAFGPSDARGTAGILAGLGMGLPFAAAGKILSQSFFAKGDLRSVVAVSLVATAVTFGGAWLLMAGWAGTGLALGVALGFATHAVLLGALLMRRGWWRPDRRCARRVAASLGASALMALLVAAAASRLGPWLEGEQGRAAAAVSLAAICLLGLVASAGLSFAFGAWTRDDARRLRRP